MFYPKGKTAKRKQNGERRSHSEAGGPLIGNGAVEPGKTPGRNRTLTLYSIDLQRQISKLFLELALVDNMGRGPAREG
jgi:hypothetical protein